MANMSFFGCTRLSRDQLFHGVQDNTRNK